MCASAIRFQPLTLHGQGVYRGSEAAVIAARFTEYIRKHEDFEAWYENPIDLPGRWYLQAVEQLFKENRLAKGQFVGLGKTLSLGDIHCPVTLLAGESDDITTSEQVFNADQYLGTPASDIVKLLAPGGHIGLFMGSRTLREYWPGIAQWLVQGQA